MSNLKNFSNWRGATINKEFKFIKLPLCNEEIKYKFLSVGILKEEKNNLLIPVATIEIKSNTPSMFKLPIEFLDWAIYIVGLANEGVRLFPEYVTISNKNNKYFIDILNEIDEPDMIFWYDETYHDRKITSATLENQNFKKDFFSIFVGIDLNQKNNLEELFCNWENKYKSLFKINLKTELKSTTIFKSKEMEHGIASIKNNKKIDLISKFLDILINNKIFFHIGIFNKIVYLIQQLFSKHKNNLKFIYSTSKMLSTFNYFKPITHFIENNIDDGIKSLFVFFEDKSKLNWPGANAAKEILVVLKSLTKINYSNINNKWNYIPSFIGVERYIKEQNFDKKKIKIIIDNDKNTYLDAKKIFIHVENENSKNEFGLRISDILIGLISRLVIVISESRNYKKNQIEFSNNLLDINFFKLSESQFKIYQKLFKLYFLINNSYHKQFSSIYTESITFLSYLKYVNKFKTYEEYKKISVENHQNDENIFSFYEYQSYLRRI